MDINNILEKAKTKNIKYNEKLDKIEEELKKLLNKKNEFKKEMVKLQQKEEKEFLNLFLKEIDKRTGLNNFVKTELKENTDMFNSFVNNLSEFIKLEIENLETKANEIKKVGEIKTEENEKVENNENNNFEN